MKNIKPKKRVKDKEMIFINIEKANKILEEFNVNPEELKGEAKKLFESIMKIANERDRLIKINNLMAKYIGDEDVSEKFCLSRYKDLSKGCDEFCNLCVKEYFEKKVSDDYK